jgi:molybdopterin-guanine dinucleotide biosynthesis protein A
LLTGGASTRMGTDKALIQIRGRRLVDLASARLREVSADAVEVGPGHSGLPATLESPAGAGPLAAFVAGADALAERGVQLPPLVLAVDMPLVTVALLRLLAAAAGDRAVVPVAGARVQPLCAVYPLASVEVARRLLADGHGSMRALLDAVPLRRMGEEEWRKAATADAFADVDTPEALLAVRHAAIEIRAV